MYLVFDLGGTFVKFAWINEEGEIKEQGKFRTPFQRVEDLVKKMVDVFDQGPEKAEGIAISCPGTVDINSGVIYYGGTLTYLHETNLPKMLKEICGVPVSIENDGKCAALAELWLGSIKDYRHAVVLVLGTGVGGGLIIDGKLHRGANLSAGEISYVMDQHMIEDSEVNFFGIAGSASRMVNEIAKCKGLEDNDGEAVFHHINQGDPEAAAIFEKYCQTIALQILNLQHILDPEVFSIGGGISVQPIVLEGIKQAIHSIKQNNPILKAEPHVVSCHFRSAANLYGALYHYLLQQK
ncbi:putative NBD/HSP70 family sugar kinase [Natronobacillus azotifigens]|uniref:ROK family protein n=1 Tax=Natronobacillus azotifigens TaxID=472978 RepID=A0A9J6RHP6_9BACI|nr:ROK family protein [Natronobacillus azotifigens]MCZ0704641.1 ROK family protein [Natronobacillus azotifigens]